MYFIDTFGSTEGENVRDAGVITMQREQYMGIVHLFIGKGRRLDKITFMSLITNYDHNTDYQGLYNLFLFCNTPGVYRLLDHECGLNT